LNYSSVESSLRLASKKLDLISSRRERLIKDSRDIISLSAKTIINIHTLNYAEAKTLSREAKNRLDELRQVAGSDLVRYILMPEQEYVESSVMMSITNKKPLPSLEKLGVAPSSYILGLLDAIGELKRSIYDNIRQNEIREAEEKFGMMESFYTLLSPFAVYDNIVQGVKRKLDVARMIIEDTRAAITEETRRSEFMSAVTELSTKLGTAPFIQTKRKRNAREDDSESKPEQDEKEKDEETL
jgi:translin